MHARDVSQAEADARGDRLASALDRTAGPPTAATEPEGGRELPGDEVELGARTRHASRVVAALGVLELAVQIRQPFAVVRPCPAVEDGISGHASGHPKTLSDELRGARLSDRRAARVGPRTRGGGYQIGDVNLPARVGEQECDIAEPLAVPQAHGLARI